MTSVEVKKILNTLLRDPENNKCADCKTATHPRWASWSLGAFICIRCAGYHRSMGTHISKVKSVDLDTWKEEHLAEVVKYGSNKKFNEHYENKLGGGTYIPDPSKIGQFIRTKYELKKWVGEEPLGRATVDKKVAIDDQRIVEKPSHQQPPIKQSRSQLELNLTPVATGGSSSESTSSTAASLNSSSTQLGATPGNSHRPKERSDLKKSILSLYSTPRLAQSSPSETQLHTPIQQSSTSINSSNPWAGPQTSQQNDPSQSSLSLDDDLFKNVWS